MDGKNQDENFFHHVAPLGFVFFKRQYKALLAMTASHLLTLTYTSCFKMIASFTIKGIVAEKMMAYTVKQVSELSGVTIRTLHYYEEIGLLKPAYHGANGYRYYEEKELLALQQILFFRQLRLTLRQIRKVLGRSDFDLLAALYSHKRALEEEWEKIGKLRKTIDKTIKHIKGRKKMKDKELFNGFHTTLVTRAKAAESYFAAESIVLGSVKNPTSGKRSKEFHENTARQAHAIFKELTACIEEGFDPTSARVQRIIQKHHTFTGQFHNATREVYCALAKLYEEHPEFRKQLDPFHPKLGSFMAEAMRVFAKRKLSK
jgi:DNA-binding transcriptional MerR regulator